MLVEQQTQMELLFAAMPKIKDKEKRKRASRLL